MKRILSIVVLVLVAMVPAAANLDTGDLSPASLDVDNQEQYRSLCSGFIPNVGQYDPGVGCVLQYQGTTVFFTTDGLVLTHTSGSVENISGDVIRQSFVGASQETHLAAGGRRSGVVNYYVGNDSSKWLLDIPVYSKIVYEDLYPGIDLTYFETDGRLKREFRVSPGADPSRIELRYEEESGPRVDADGVLRFASPAGEMLESPLVCWQEVNGERVDRAAAYVVDEGSVRIEVAEYDTEYALIIDPELVYSSYLGGASDDGGSALAGDGSGGVWVAGETDSSDFPVTNAYQSTSGGGYDAFVAKLSDPLTADFSAEPASGPAPLAVQFADTSTGNPTTWSWSFGDGNTSTEQNPVHTYAAAGTYTVNLTVGTGSGQDTLSRPGYITVTVKGDVTGDGIVDISDVARVAYTVVGKETVDPAADFNGNGKVDIGDAAKIAYYFVEKIGEL